jgi:superoxide reductase
MAKRLEIYKCEVCGNIVEVLHGGEGDLFCCGQPMELQDEQTADFAVEKHVPVVEGAEAGTHVVVGSTLHPMEEKHYIEWIEMVTKDGKTVRQFLKPGVAPDAQFCEAGDAAEKVREYCNVHGLWKA